MLVQYRFVVVIALLGLAAALATPKGRLPLALRGIRRTLRRDAGAPAAEPSAARAVPLWKRLVAFALVLLAFLIGILPDLVGARA